MLLDTTRAQAATTCAILDGGPAKAHSGGGSQNRQRPASVRRQQ